MLAGILPRLKQNARKQRGEQKPLATKTLGRMVRDMCIVYRLLTERSLTKDQPDSCILIVITRTGTAVQY